MTFGGPNVSRVQANRLGVFVIASGTATGAWALVDMAGNSRVGFWPLFIGDHRFVLALGGLPALNHPALVELVWSLTFRYGGPELAATPTPGRQAQ